MLVCTIVLTCKRINPGHWAWSSKLRIAHRAGRIKSTSFRNRDLSYANTRQTIRLKSSQTNAFCMGSPIVWTWGWASSLNIWDTMISATSRFLTVFMKTATPTNTRVLYWLIRRYQSTTSPRRWWGRTVVSYTQLKTSKVIFFQRSWRLALLTLSQRWTKFGVPKVKSFSKPTTAQCLVSMTATWLTKKYGVTLRLRSTCGPKPCRHLRELITIKNWSSSVKSW